LIYEQIIDVINKSSIIAVTSHVVPDGDNIGSSLALCLALQKLNKQAVYVIDDNIPEVYKFLKGAKEAKRFDSSANHNYDLVIALDCGDIDRLGKVKQLAENTKLINIDHHMSNTMFGEINLVEENASATAEITYKLIKSMGIFIDKDMAECIYTGIVTDTGMFQYSNTSEETHSIAAELIIAGVSPSDIFKKVYQNSPKEKVILMKEALKSLEFYFDDKVSCITISKAQIDNITKDDLDTEGIVNLARDISGIEAAVFLKEKEPNIVKVSLRSKDKIDVCAIAKEFGGGGHIRAAGCTITNSLEQAKQQLLQAIKKHV
jgi:bifunctional oligoribonuclease and PAP phosphatase NrnA